MLDWRFGHLSFQPVWKKNQNSIFWVPNSNVCSAHSFAARLNFFERSTIWVIWAAGTKPALSDPKFLQPD
jgi:hypothetical protein